MVSVILPTGRDPYLQKTLTSVLNNSTGDIEVIPVLDGFVPERPLKKDSRVKPVYLRTNVGMREAINTGIKASHGEYIMKLDSHCCIDRGFDTKLINNIEDNWLVVPRRYSLDEINWTKNETRPIKDYHYFAFPQKHPNYGVSLSTMEWNHRTSERANPKYDIDDTFAFQGSCWVANRKYFMKLVGFLDSRLGTYGPWSGDVHEMVLKYWLSGKGEVKVNKKTWYAHLNKRPGHYKAGMFSRSYKMSANAISGHIYTAKHWLNNEEPNMKYKFSWLLEKFWPVPSWPEDRSLWVYPK